MDGELDSAVDIQALSINTIARETLVNFMASHDQLRDHLATFLAADNSAKRLKTLWGLPVRRMTAMVPLQPRHRIIAARPVVEDGDAKATAALLRFDQLSLKPLEVDNVQGLKLFKQNEQFSPKRCQLRIPAALKFGDKVALARDTKHFPPLVHPDDRDTNMIDIRALGCAGDSLI